MVVPNNSKGISNETIKASTISSASNSSSNNNSETSSTSNNMIGFTIRNTNNCSNHTCIANGRSHTNSIGVVIAAVIVVIGGAVSAELALLAVT